MMNDAIRKAKYVQFGVIEALKKASGMDLSTEGAQEYLNELTETFLEAQRIIDKEKENE